MKLDNPTPFDATALPMMGPSDRTILAVIVKATFAFSMDKTDLAPEQAPLAYGDTFYDESEGGGICYESDLIPYKPRADVVLSGKAYAPDKQPAEAVEVALKVGPLQKRLKVFGRRLWNHAGVLSRRYVITDAKPFVIHPIRYNDAFGGMDNTTGEYCDQNLSGKGFYAVKTKAKLIGRPLPRIEDPRHLVAGPNDHPAPAGFGFYHRAWQPRAAFAGTYNNTWRVERSPRPPADFDFRFYNGAHPDLQAKGYLKGDEAVVLTNLTPEGHMQFTLPGIAPHCQVKRMDQPEAQTIAMNLDTLFIEPDARTFCLVWRGAAPLAELSEAEIEQVALAVGKVSN
jgi:hypothetical protein